MISEKCIEDICHIVYLNHTHTQLHLYAHMTSSHLQFPHTFNWSTTDLYKFTQRFIYVRQHYIFMCISMTFDIGSVLYVIVTQNDESV